MSDPSKPAQPPEPGPRRRASYANPGMRISDAERAEVSDLLSKHYGEGRLDEAEFSRRLDQALHAVTQADLNGLFDDLPENSGGHGGPAASGKVTAGRATRSGSGESGGPPLRSGRPPAARILAVIALVLVAVIAGHALAHMFIPWLLIAVLVFLWLRHGPGRRHREPRPDA